MEKLEKYPTNPDGTFDEKAKAIADAFNNWESSIVIDGKEFRIDKKEQQKPT